MYGLIIIIVPTLDLSIADDVANSWKKMVSHADTTYSMVKLTQYHVPEAETFNLLGAVDGNTNSKENESISQPSKEGKL